LRQGKQAIASNHRSLIVETQNARCKDSLNFDDVSTALALLPNEKRWDYFLSTQGRPDETIAVEVHPFRASDLIQKKKGTIKILDATCTDASAEITSWHVLVTSEMRSDLAQKFSAETRIRLHRTLSLKDIR
jgi:hypothetical protein